MNLPNDPSRRSLLALSASALAGFGLMHTPLAGAQAKAKAAAPESAADTARLLDDAIAGPQRSAANKARDVYRHPKETLLFFGLRPAQTVIEIAPGGGWYTKILAPLLHDHGKLYAAHYALDSKSQEERTSRTRFDAKLLKEASVYDKVAVGTMPVNGFTDIAPPGGADMVLTFRNIHNWIQEGTLDTMLAAFFKVLKPGGVLGVEEHRAAPGTPLEKIISSGYVPEAFVVEHCRAVGFRLDGDSEINANPRDTKDYGKGVWALPPTYRGGDVDRAKLADIGESDRMTLRLVRPA